MPGRASGGSSHPIFSTKVAHGRRWPALATIWAADTHPRSITVLRQRHATCIPLRSSDPLHSKSGGRGAKTGCKREMRLTTDPKAQDLCGRLVEHHRMLAEAPSSAFSALIS